MGILVASCSGNTIDGDSHPKCWLEKQKAEEVKKLIKKAKNDPDEVDRILKEKFNIEEI